MTADDLVTTGVEGDDVKRPYSHIGHDGVRCGYLSEILEAIELQQMEEDAENAKFERLASKHGLSDADLS